MPKIKHNAYTKVPKMKLSYIILFKFSYDASHFLSFFYEWIVFLKVHSKVWNNLWQLKAL